MPELRLVDDSVCLRRYSEADAPAVFDAVRESISDLKVWLEWAHDDYSIDETEAWLIAQEDWWRNGQVFNFAVTDPDTQTYLGGCLLNHINYSDSFANLSYWVRSGWNNKGVATAASRLVAAYGLKELALNRIEIIMATENKGSVRVAEKIGAQREGELRKRIRVHDTVYNAWMYSLLLDDLP